MTTVGGAPRDRAAGASLSWTREDRPVYDAAKRRVVDGAPPGALDLAYSDGAELPGDWFVATDVDGAVVGIGSLDVTWGGDAEVLLAVDPDHHSEGVGSFVLDHLEQEAVARGVNYVYNTVAPTHPDHDAVHDWLAVRGYVGSTSNPALRKRVGGQEAATFARRTGAGGGATPDATADQPPGHEESGGYVDVEDHRY